MDEVRKTWTWFYFTLWKESWWWPISTKRTFTSHINWTHWTQQTPRHMTLEIQVFMSWDTYKHVERLHSWSGYLFNYPWYSIYAI